MQRSIASYLFEDDNVHRKNYRNPGINFESDASRDLKELFLLFRRNMVSIEIKKLIEENKLVNHPKKKIP